MVNTPSTMVPLGTQSPPFSLPDTAGKVVSLDDFKDSPALLVVFLCNHCPFVKHILPKLVELARNYRRRGRGLVGINPNDVVHYPDDSPEKMAQLSEIMDFPFPYLYDESQQVARAYGAACTPDFYLPDADAYIECTVMKQANVNRKNQKARKLRERYGEVVAVLYRSDFQRLRRKYGRRRPL